MYRLCVNTLLCIALGGAMAGCSSSSSKSEPKPPVVTSTKSGSAPSTPATSPVKSEVVKAEPVKADSTKSESSKTESSKTESSKSDSGKGDSGKGDSGKNAAANKKATGDAAKTAPIVDAAPELPPIPPDLSQRFERALSMMSSGDLLRAESELQKLTASYPNFSGPFANLGVIYLKNGRFADAEKALLTATKLSPQSAAAFNQLGIVYRNLGKFKEADVAYTNALAADSGYALAYLNLGVLCDMYLQQPKRALEAFEHYQTLTAKPDAKVEGWVKELRGRLGIKATAPKPEASAAVPASSPAETPKDEARVQ